MKDEMGAGPAAGRKKARRGTGKAAAGAPAIGNFALILGAMKSGTTTLYDYLVTHPEIAACVRKEPSFFASDRRRKLPRRYYRLWPDFDPRRHRYAIEASVDYTKQPRYRNVTKWIGEFPANFKYIYIMRDPVDRIESQIAHNIAKGRITRENYADNLEATISTSRYAYQLDAFREPLGDPEVLLLDFDELRRDPMTLLARVVDFLGIDPTFTFAERPASNTRKAVNDSETFRLSAEERARYRAELAPDMARLARTYGFDVARWGFDPAAAPSPAPVLPPPVPPAVRAAPPSPGAEKASPPKNRDKTGKTGKSRSYWSGRRKMVCYDCVRAMVGRFAAGSRSLLDVGSHGTGLVEEFKWIPERVSLDLREPYSSEAVRGIEADFLTFDPGRRYDFVTCLQVLDHVPDAEAFAKRLLAVSDRVLVSVRYLWPGDPNDAHGHDPVDEAKLDGWFGRAPDHRVIAQEPLRGGPESRRMIAYYHNVPGETFSLRPPRARSAAAPAVAAAPRDEGIPEPAGADDQRPA
ncbi:sulfotransferase [Amaricoccus solimangrovi]|nr:sulfotransferase [Amaricoccus solimangrovi]